MEEPRKKPKWLQFVLVYLFPAVVVLWHFVAYTEFLKENWIFYVFGFGLLFYTHYSYAFSEDKKDQHFVRKVYFLQTCFFILFVFPELNTKYNLWKSGSSLFGLNEAASTGIMIFIIAFILYVAVISDFHISEISFGNTRITMLKKKYGEEVRTHMRETNSLLEKIKAEAELFLNMKTYALEVYESIGDSEIDFLKEYQVLLNNYFSKQKEKINVYAFDTLSKLTDLGFKDSEIEFLDYQIKREEIFSYSNKRHYLFFAFYYVFEELKGEKPVYIILESETPSRFVAESHIMRNILIKFSDDLYEVILKGGNLDDTIELAGRDENGKE